MKNLVAITLVAALTGSCLLGFAQKKKEIPEVKYRRSSLHTVLIQSGGYQMSDLVEGAFHKAPFPDQYNNHDVGSNILNRRDYPISNAEREAGGAKRTKGSEFGNKLASSASGGITDPNAADVPFQIEKFIQKNKIANKMVAKWWNQQPDGSFNMDRIYKRGKYDASALDTEVAQGTIRGSEVMAADAGMELIDKTFVVFNKMNFVENEKMARPIYEKATLAASKLPNAILAAAATKSAEVAYRLTKEGYTIFTTSYLYKLNWSDSVEAIFFQDYWVDPTDEAAVKTSRMIAFDQTDLFQLELVGKSKASSVVMPVNNPLTNKPSMPANDVIEMAVVRNIDAVYVKLQKAYDVFKPMTPLYSVNPITARIGMKEGLSGGEKFEVLEQSIDPKTQKTIYKRKGIIKVEKASIWDNRTSAFAEPKVPKELTPEEIERQVEMALAGETPEPTEEETAAKEAKIAAGLGATTFKGGSKYYPGMLIRQMK